MCELGVSSLLLVITHQIGFDEISDIAIHDSLYIGGLVSGAMVFYTAVVKDVTADLLSPFDFFLFAFEFVLELAPFIQFELVEF